MKSCLRDENDKMSTSLDYILTLLFVLKIFILNPVSVSTFAIIP